MVRVIGAGFGRTGTLSMKLALEMLGLGPCYHMVEVRNHPTHPQLWLNATRGQAVDWAALFDGYASTVDWPSCNFWRQQMQAFPEAKVLLTLRDSDRWYESVMNTIWPASSRLEGSAVEAEARAAEFAFGVVWDPVFGRRMTDRAHCIEMYEQHNQEVMDEVPADRLLCYQPGDGWEPLCEFLDLPVPDAPYPRVNSTEDFRASLT